MEQTSQAFALAPRLKHNQDLATKYLADNGIYARWPRVTKQVQCVPLDTSSLPKYAYAPTIIDHNAMTLMCYRFHEGSLATKLGVAVLDSKWKVVSNRTLNLAGTSEEDPHLFRWGNQVCVSWVDSTWPQRPPKSVVRFGAFKDGTLRDFQTPPLPGNDGSTMQKNWILWEHIGTLYCIYTESGYTLDKPADHKRHVYELLDNNKWDQIQETPSPRWPYGEIRGGTVPVEHNGMLLRFFHSALDNEWGPQPRRYFVGAYLMEPEPPFKVLKVSRKPILYGSELDNIPIDDRPKIIHHKINVVFPGGVVKRGNDFYLAIGINDSACAVAVISPGMLNL